MRGEVVKVVVKAEISRGTARAQLVGWVATIDPLAPLSDITSTVTDICRRLRDDVQEALK